MSDKNSAQAPTLQSPATSAEAVTPSDTINLGSTSRSLYVGTGGNITAVLQDSTVVLFSNVPGGFILPVRVTRVNATATTASNIVSLS